jgi:hypothetical protein
MRVALDSWALKLLRCLLPPHFPVVGSRCVWLMEKWCPVHCSSCVSYQEYCEWPLVRREVRLRWCSAGISTRLYTIWYIITLWAYARLLCCVCHWSCCSMAVILLMCWYSPVANLAARRCTASTLLMLSSLLGLHMLDVYSRVGRTNVVHCISLCLDGSCETAHITS